MDDATQRHRTDPYKTFGSAIRGRAVAFRGSGSYNGSESWNIAHHDPGMTASMSDRAQTQKSKLETVEPLGKRVLIRKDEDKKVTKGGIELPDSIEIPTITGRIVAVSAQVAHDDDFPIKQYDRVLFNPKHAIPVEFDADNFLYVVPIEDVVAVFRKAT
jgi:chaperonin GroES